MKSTKIKIIILMALLCNFLTAAEKKVEFTQIQTFKVQVPMEAGTVFLLLAELAEMNINVTTLASTTNMKCSFKGMSALNIIDSLCKTSGLVYSYNRETSAFIVMTLEEYRQKLPVNVKHLIKTFKVEPENLESIPQLIDELFPGKVEVSYGSEIKTFDDQLENGRQSTSNSNSSRSSSTSSQLDLKNRPWLQDIDLTVEQIIKLEKSKIFLRDDERAPDIHELIELLRVDLAPAFVTVNNEHNMLVVRTFGKKSLELIADIITNNNKMVPQVLLEMKILELTLGDGFTSSFDYNLTNTPSNGDNLDLGNVSRVLSSSFTYETLHSNLQAKIQLLKSKNQLEVLATPILMAANNRVAEFNVTDEDLLLTGFTTGSRTVTAQNGGTTTEFFSLPQYSTTDIGLSLKILPKIVDGKRMTLTIEQESSTKKVGATSIQFLVGDTLEERTIDIKSERSITQTIKAMDSKAIAIGGLVSTRNVTNIESVPILGSIPLLGYFFRSEVTTNVKTELILMITPHIINSESDLKKSQELLKKISDHKFHIDGQQGIDAKVNEIDFYKNPRSDIIRDFVKDPIETLNKKKKK